MFNVVLIEPEIPQNTGNIVRSCAATGSKLHLIEPLGFSLEDKYLKRAGLDYWPFTEIKIYKNIQEFYEQNTNYERMFYSTTKGQKVYSEIEYQDGDYLIFGKETAGIDEDILHDNYDRAIRIPMIGDIRSLNLANSVAIVLFEALRQTDFEGFNLKGKLRKY